MSTPVYGSNSFVNTPDVNGTLVMLNGGGNAQITTGTLAARPAASTAGNIYCDTTTKAVWQDTGAAWNSLSRVVNTYTVAIPLSTSTATLALSNTLPTSAAGTQIATITLTPVATTSKFLLQSAVTLTSNTAGATVILLVFRGTTLIGAAQQICATAAALQNVSFHITDSPATVASTTYSVKVVGTAGTTYVGESATFTTLFGSIDSASTFSILELL